MQLKYFLLLIVALFMLNGCSGSSGDAKKASSEIGQIYSSSAQVDPNVPTLITGKSGFYTGFRTRTDVEILSYGDIDVANVTFADGIFSWLVQPQEVGYHTILLGDDQNHTQEVTFRILSDLPLPTGLSASQGESSSSITLEFDGDFASYNVYYSLTQDGVFTYLGTVNDSYYSPTTYTHYLSDEDKLLSLSYYYKVQGISVDGRYSEKTSAVRGYLISDAPTSATANLSAAINKVEVTWSTNNINLLYNIYRSEGCEDGAYTKLNDQEIALTHYVDDSVSLGSIYCYKLSSLANGVETLSEFTSNAIKIVVPKPAYFVVRFDADLNNTNLSWSGVDGASSYTLYRDGEELTQTTSTFFSESDISFENATYALEANYLTNSSAKRYYSFEAKPYLEASKGVFLNKIELSWDAINGATNYNVFYSSTKDGTYTQIYANISDTNVSVVSLNGENLTSDTAYFFKVQGDDPQASYTTTALGYSATVVAYAQNLSYVNSSGGYNDIVGFAHDSNGTQYILDGIGGIYKVDLNGSKNLLTTITNASDMAIDDANNLYILENLLQSDDAKEKFQVHKKDANSTTFQVVNENIYDVESLSANGTSWYALGNELKSLVSKTITSVDDVNRYYYYYYYYNKVGDNYSSSYDETNGYIYSPDSSGSYYRGPDGEFLTLESETVDVYEWSEKGVLKDGAFLFSVEDILPNYIFVDENEDIYISEYSAGIIYKYSPSGVKSVFSTDILGPGKMAMDEEQHLYVTTGNSLYKLDDIGRSSRLLVYMDNNIKTLNIYNDTAYMSIYGDIFIYDDSYTYKTVLSLNVSKDIAGTKDYIALSWKRVEGIKNYLLYRSQENNASFELYKDDLLYSGFKDSNISEHKVYFYKVMPVFENIDGEFSQDDFGFTGNPAPFNVRASEGIYDQTIELTWSSVDVGVGVKFNIYRATSIDGEYTPIESNYDSAAKTYVDSTGLTPNAEYYYKLKANLFGSLSEFSKEALGYLKPTSPNPVEIRGTIDSIELSWEAIPGVSHYKIYVSDSATGEYTLLASVDTTSYIDTSVTYLETKYYKVVTEFNGMESDFEQDGNDYLVMTAEVAPPSDINASQGEFVDKIVVSWNENPNAQSYTLYRATSKTGSYSAVLSDTTLTSYEESVSSIDTAYYYKIASKYQGVYGYQSSAHIGYTGGVAETEVFKDALLSASLLTTDKDDNVYHYDSYSSVLNRISQSGLITELANAISMYGMVTDSRGYVYVLNSNGITKIAQDGTQTQFSSNLDYSYYMAIDSEDNIYVNNNSTNYIYKIAQDGTTVTFATGMTGVSALTMDKDDNLYVSFYNNGYKIYKITPNGTQTDLRVTVESPNFLSVDTNHNLYVVNTGDTVVYKIRPDGNMTRFAENFAYLAGMTIDTQDRLYVSDSNIKTIYKINILKSQIPYGLTLDEDTLYWQPARDAVSYNIYTASSSDGIYSLAYTSTTTSYTLSESDAYFKVAGVRADGTLTEYSNSIEAVVILSTTINVESFTGDWSEDYLTYYTANHSFRSASISDDQDSCAETSINDTGTLSFYWRVSSEDGYDKLTFYVDGESQEYISGERDWEEKTYEQYSSGTHVYKWCYSKDASVSTGSDAGWIDEVVFE